MILLFLALAAHACHSGGQLPPDLAGWARDGQTLDTGHTIVLTGKPGGSVETSVTIRRAGTFGVAVDQRAWVDIYRGRGKPLRMASESHGPACSGIVKIVRYQLEPGSYRVVVDKLVAPRVKLMLVHGRPAFGQSRAPYSRSSRYSGYSR